MSFVTLGSNMNSLGIECTSSWQSITSVLFKISLNAINFAKPSHGAQECFGWLNLSPEGFFFLHGGNVDSHCNITKQSSNADNYEKLCFRLIKYNSSNNYT